MTDRSVFVDAHSYVDNCLDPEARRAFEAKLSEDAALRRQVECWRAQNEAIRIAYGAPLRPVGAIAFGRPGNQSASWMPPPISSRRAAAIPREHQSSAGLSRPAGARRDFRPRARADAPPYVRLALVLTLSLGLLILSAWGGPTDPRGVLRDVGLSAYRAFAAGSTAPFDYSTIDARALEHWLSLRFSPAASEAGGFEITGWTLVGVRIVPGTASPAAFIVWQNAEAMRAGLLVEPLDAPATYAPSSRDKSGLATAAWTAGGRGFAAIAPDAMGLQALTRLGVDFGSAH